MKKKQFTLVELIIVIVVIAILVAIAMLNVGDWRKEATKSAILSNIKNIQTASDMYNLDGHTDTIGIKKPTILSPSGIDFDKITPKYLRSEPNKGKYWIDSNEIIWGATIEPPAVSKEGNTYHFEENKKAEDHHVYEVTDGSKLTKLKDAEIKDNTFTGNPGTEYVFSSEDELGLETVPVGEGMVEVVDSICSQPIQFGKVKNPVSTNFTNKLVYRALTNYEDVIKDKDGNYIAVGAYAGFDDYFPDDQLVFDKYDKNLKLIDSFSLNTEGSTGISDVIQDKDGNYVAVGQTSGDFDLSQYGAAYESYRPAIIFKLSKDFNTIKTATYVYDPNSYEDSLFTELASDNEGNYLALTSDSLVKFDKNLKMVDEGVAGASNIQYTDLAVNKAGQVFVSGSVGNKPSIFELNSDLETVETKTLTAAGSLSGKFNEIIIDSDNHVVAAGKTSGELTDFTVDASAINYSSQNTIMAKFNSDLTLIKGVYGEASSYGTPSTLSEENGQYFYIYSSNLFTYNKNMERTAKHVVEKVDYDSGTEQPILVDGNTHGLLVDGNSYILFEKSGYEEGVTSTYSIGIIKDFNATNLTVEKLPYPDRFSIGGYVHLVGEGATYEEEEIDEPDYIETYAPTYIANYTNDSGIEKVDPIYQGSVIYLNNLNYLVQSNGELVENNSNQPPLASYSLNVSKDRLMITYGTAPNGAVEHPDGPMLVREQVMKPSDSTYHAKYNSSKDSVDPSFAGHVIFLGDVMNSDFRVVGNDGKLFFPDLSYIPDENTAIFTLDKENDTLTYYPVMGPEPKAAQHLLIGASGDENNGGEEVKEGFLFTAYLTGYDKETQTVDSKFANSLFVPVYNGGISEEPYYHVDATGKLTKYNSSYEVPYELRDNQSIPNYTVMGEPTHVMKHGNSLSGTTIKLNCYTDTYFVNVVTGEITYIDSKGNSIPKGKINDAMTSRNFGENPVDIQLYYFDPSSGYIDEYPPGRGHTIV